MLQGVKAEDATVMSEVGCGSSDESIKTCSVVPLEELRTLKALNVSLEIIGDRARFIDGPSSDVQLQLPSRSGPECDC